MKWLIDNSPLVLAIAYAIVSEALSIVQMLKFPGNSGIGGILSGILKVLKALGAGPRE